MAEIMPGEGIGLWDARELAKSLDGLTAPQFHVIRRENWGFTKNEWLALNEIPSDAVGRIWTVQEFDATLTSLSAMYGKNRVRKLPRIPTQISTLPISQQQARPIDGSTFADVLEQNKFRGQESMEQGY